ncbi:MAG: iron ABC transporter permease [Desulfovibrionaceae bacterium]|nr:iron ABC transporter permease [Desulfovibrionaceae bacterium]
MMTDKFEMPPWFPKEDQESLLAKSSEHPAFWLLGAAALCAACFSGLYCGTVSIAPEEILSAVFGLGGDPGVEMIVRDIRLPRLLTGLAAGASLAACGLVFQTIFRNPLAEPYLLGVSSGASCAVMAGLLLGCGDLFRPIWAFCGGILPSLLLLRFGRHLGRTALLLRGVMLNAFFSALILLLMAQADPFLTGSAILWTMGDLGSCGLSESLLYAGLSLAILMALLGCSRWLDSLLLDDDSASSLGMPVSRVRFALLALSCFAVSLTSAVSGPLGFVGLVVPHLMRSAFGGLHGRLMPACMIFGASYLVFCDIAAANILKDGELPVGVVTALIGAVFFIAVMRRRT